jgi:hypothetical protein
VFYWNGAGQTVYGTVQQVEYMEDVSTNTSLSVIELTFSQGAMVVKVRDDNGQTVALPYADTFKTRPFN